MGGSDKKLILLSAKWVNNEYLSMENDISS
jgi:hypothetical protein